MVSSRYTDRENAFMPLVRDTARTDSLENDDALVFKRGRSAAPFPASEQAEEHIAQIEQLDHPGELIGQMQVAAFHGSHGHHRAASRDWRASSSSASCS